MAEQFYLKGKKWNKAIEMYESKSQYDDCIRICKYYASDRDTVSKAKQWETKIGTN